MCTLIDMRSRHYKGSWLSLRRQKKDWLSTSKFSFFMQWRTRCQLNKIKKRYHLNFTNPHHISAFSSITDLRFPLLCPQLKIKVQEANISLFFLAGMIDQLHNGQVFFLGLSQRTLEWLDVYLCNAHNHDVTHYRYHIFDRYWKDNEKPQDAMQIHATINIYFDEIFYLIAQNALYSPFRANMKFPNVNHVVYNPYQMIQI